MTKYIIHIPSFVFALSLALGLFIFATPNEASAQYRGGYQRKEDPKAEEKLNDLIPQIFTSQVGSVKQTRKLDEVYDRLYVSLWNYAISDFNYQKQLYEQLANERFQITRYAAEFSNLLKLSMTNLNENHKKIKKNLEDAQREYKYVRERVREADKRALDELWPRKIAEYNKNADEYFEMQHKFLNTYHNLVSFILKQGGGYYYNSQEQTLKFYKLGAYDYYGKTLDNLHLISYEQMKLLKKHVPAQINPDLLK